MTEKAQHDLEWSRIVAAVAQRCRGPAHALTDLPLASDATSMRRALEESREAFQLLDAGDPLPLDGLRDVRESAVRVERGGSLEAFQLLDIIHVVAAARNLRRFLASRRNRAPRLYEACATDPSLDSLEDELRAAVDPDGTLSDRASPELARLRTEVANIRARIVGRLDEILVKHADILSDRFYTVREGRYVVPVRADAHERFVGIVHGTSSSGATVFVEPRGIVPLGNRLKVAQGELDREINRILVILSDLVRERAAALLAAVDALDHADLRNACARFAKDFEATFPELTDDATIELRASRHPVLVLEGGPVVANDISIATGHALVLSGPNAGGKTVALKTLGLAVFMSRAGLPLLAAEGSRIGFFGQVLSDVGDEQSLTKNLSTFSAHIRNVAHILSVADERSLVLLDELAGGTDPEEGAALACAVIEALCTRKAAVAVTTHYEALKAFALRDSRLRNASVGFDVEALKPTFRLYLDVPGASSALIVAAQFGIASSVLDFARQVLPEQSRGFDELVRKLQREQVVFQEKRIALEEELARAKATTQQLQDELAEQKRRGRAAVDEASSKLMDELKRTRHEVVDARKRLRDAASEADVTNVAKSVDAHASKIAIGGELAKPSNAPENNAPLPQAQALRVGDRVWVPELRGEAEVLEAPKNGRVRVALGPMKLWVDLAALRQSAPKPSQEAPARPKSAPSSETPRAFAGPLPAAHDTNTLDVRGLRVDDALGLLEAFLDRLYGASLDVGFIHHGHGTGALRDAVREKLSSASHYVAYHRPATSEEGGDRYTVVFIR